jgi:ATP-dependent Clp protease ATP-binding subunit ClpC
MNGYNFTQRLRKCLAMAREEAVRLHHDYVGTEHLLLALLREGDGIALVVIDNLSASGATIRDRVLKRLAAGTSHASDLPYTNRAKKVLELSMSEARALHHSYVGTEHLLLGLIGEGQGIAAEVLVSLGLTLERVRAETARLLGPRPDDATLAKSAIAFNDSDPMNDPLNPLNPLNRKPEPASIVVELRFPDGTTERRLCRDRHDAMRFLLQA